MAKKKLTDNLIDELTTYIENGMNNRDSASMCLITEDTLYRWLREADIRDENGNAPKKYSMQRKLKEAMQKSQAAFKAYHVNNIVRASKKNWQASAWILERKFPEEYGRGVDRLMIKQVQNEDADRYDDGLESALLSAGSSINDMTGDVPEDV